MKNQQKRVRGIVLNKRDLFGDRELTIFTETGFKIKLFVKGINKSVNREIVATDTFSYSEFIFYSNFIVNKISLIKKYKINNLEEFKIAFYLFSIIDKVVYKDVENKLLFAFLQQSLESIDKKNSKDVIIKFLSNFLQAEGIYKEFNNIKEIERHIYNYLDTHFNYNEFMKYLS